MSEITYIRKEALINDGIYIVKSRSSIVGRWCERQSAFQLYINMFKTIVVQYEKHYDDCESFGTVKPLKFLQIKYTESEFTADICKSLCHLHSTDYRSLIIGSLSQNTLLNERMNCIAKVKRYLRDQNISELELCSQLELTSKTLDGNIDALDTEKLEYLLSVLNELIPEKAWGWLTTHNSALGNKLLKAISKDVEKGEIHVREYIEMKKLGGFD